MNVLLIEEDQGTRELLSQLLSVTLDGISISSVASLGDVLIENVPPFSVIVAAVDSIQGLDTWFSKLALKEALIIQASLRFEDPGAGVRLKSMEWPSDLLCEIDQTEVDWPSQIIQRIKAHDISPEVKQR